MFLASGALFAFLAVGAGAFGAHALRKRIRRSGSTFETANRYTMYHALGLFAVVWFRTLGPDQVSETVAGIAFIVGVCISVGASYRCRSRASADGRGRADRRRVLPDRMGGADHRRGDGAARLRALFQAKL